MAGGSLIDANAIGSNVPLNAAGYGGAANATNSFLNTFLSFANQKIKQQAADQALQLGQQKLAENDLSLQSQQAQTDQFLSITDLQNQRLNQLQDAGGVTNAGDPMSGSDGAASGIAPHYKTDSVNKVINGSQTTGQGQQNNPLKWNPNSNVEGLQNKLPDPLKPLAPAYISSGQKYGVDPNFLASVSWHETGGGTSKAFKQGNNAMGISNSSGPVYGFESPEESIDRQARTLANAKGPYAGASSIHDIANIYAPVGASNDPYKQNGDWESGVGGFYNKLSGIGALASN